MQREVYGPTIRPDVIGWLLMVGLALVAPWAVSHLTERAEVSRIAEPVEVLRVTNVGAVRECAINEILVWDGDRWECALDLRGEWSGSVTLGDSSITNNVDALTIGYAHDYPSRYTAIDMPVTGDDYVEVFDGVDTHRIYPQRP